MKLHAPVMILALLTALTLTSSCGHDHGSVLEEGCEHMEAGPNKAVTAAAASAGAPDATAEHTRIDLALVDVEGGKGGVVQVKPETAGEYYLFLSADVPVKLTKAADGSQVAPEKTLGAVAECTSAIPKHYVYDLAVGTYELTFGPTTQTSVRFVFERDAGEEGHDH